MGRICLLMVLLPTLLAADRAEEAVKKELKKFQGDWKFISLEAGGKALPEEGYKDALLTIEGDKHATQNGAVAYSGTLKIDPGKKPKTIDFQFSDGPEKGKTAYGIYEFDGETLKVCVGLVGKDRPAAFVSKPGSGHVLEVLKRAKKEN